MSFNDGQRSIVVDDLEAAKAFFVELGMELEGETTVEDMGGPYRWLETFDPRSR